MLLKNDSISYSEKLIEKEVFSGPPVYYYLSCSFGPSSDFKLQLTIKDV